MYPSRLFTFDTKKKKKASNIQVLIYFYKNKAIVRCKMILQLTFSSQYHGTTYIKVHSLFIFFNPSPNIVFLNDFVLFQ